MNTSTFWTVYVPNKGWGKLGTSDYKAGYEKALLNARNLQSDRDRVINELRKLSNVTGKGKQYDGQKDRRWDRGPDTEQLKCNKQTRES